MANIPSKVQARLVSGLKKFQPIVISAKAKDINESDTVVIITDMLSELFGYDKYSEITSEKAVKKTYCDLAIKVNEKIKFFIEVKAAGLDLKADHIRQAVDYGSNAGVDWVILTNSYCWKVFKIIFGKPVGHELIYEFDFSQLNSKKDTDLDQLFYFCKESLAKANLENYYIQKQTFSKFFVGQLIISEPIVDAIRKTLKKLSPDIKVSNQEVIELIQKEVLKREVIEGEKVEEAKKRIAKAFKSLAKDSTTKNINP
ncbi:MAG: restriction endonuclease subunit R [Bacteroidetes bacterium GWF2_38_335]|nr:MAG: restriction endonuclease subunit R [Bacteroidetes bacterium GWF2_38_335]OFY82010.1 MAG: restriction endonuclease subunit R [Bacteroidetes bacterium RIFOXYA12_FULL_38_20]HBS86488.1 restriction endonuclease subunit R [Bacteroidales bacterium]